MRLPVDEGYTIPLGKTVKLQATGMYSFHVIVGGEHLALIPQDDVLEAIGDTYDGLEVGPAVHHGPARGGEGER